VWRYVIGAGIRFPCLGYLACVLVFVVVFFPPVPDLVVRLSSESYVVLEHKIGRLDKVKAKFRRLFDSGVLNPAETLAIAKVDTLVVGSGARFLYMVIPFIRRVMLSLGL